MNKIHLSIMMLLVVGMLSVPAFADDDDRNERDDDRDSSHEESNESVFDEIGEHLSGQSEENERHENRDESSNSVQNSQQMTILQDRISFLEKQIEGKDSIIAEQMKVIMMLVERINLVVFDQIMMPVFGI